MYLLQANITEYSHSNDTNYEPTRKRKLLMHKKEINKLRGKIERKGYTLVVTKMYFVGSLVKCELALAKGKQLFDKRKTMKEKDQKREIERELARKKY